MVKLRPGHKIICRDCVWFNGQIRDVFTLHTCSRLQPLNVCLSLFRCGGVMAEMEAMTANIILSIQTQVFIQQYLWNLCQITEDNPHTPPSEDILQLEPLSDREEIVF